MAEIRLAKIQTQARCKVSDSERITVFGKWPWIMFWLIIPNEIAALMCNDIIAGFFPGLYMPGELLSAACNITYGLIMLKLAAADGRYRVAAVCGFIVITADIGLVICFGSGTLPEWVLWVHLPAIAVSMISIYHECVAHAAVLAALDRELSDEWISLGKWYVYVLVAAIVGIFPARIFPVFGTLILIATLIGKAVCSIWKTICLYRTAKIFRNRRMRLESNGGGS